MMAAVDAGKLHASLTALFCGRPCIASYISFCRCCPDACPVLQQTFAKALTSELRAPHTSNAILHRFSGVFACWARRTVATQQKSRFSLEHCLNSDRLVA
jgi:hypothetical protein